MADQTTQHLTPDLIVEAIAGYAEIQVGNGDAGLVFDHKGGGEFSVMLFVWDEAEEIDVKVDARTFRIVEVAR